MVKGFRTVGLALAAVFFAAGSARAVVSVDFVYSGYGVFGGGPTTPASGDTTATLGLSMTNAYGLIFTGQTGAWNAVDVGTNNEGANTASKANLLNGLGVATGVSFLMGTAADPASPTPPDPANWHTNYSGGIDNGSITGGLLRDIDPNDYMKASEFARLGKPDGATGESFSWAFTGLQANATYNLALFGNGPALWNATYTKVTANGVELTSSDDDGDWNFANIAADANGRISGTLASDGNYPGLFGAQIASAATPANFTATPAGPFDFGTVGVSTISGVQTVTLTNNGGTAGNVTGASVTGGFAFTIPLPGDPPYSVAPAGTAVYGIQLPAQTLPGTYTGQATFATSAGGPFTYDLTATVIAHDGDVNGDGQVSLLDYNIIKVNFGNVYESGKHWNDGDVNGDLQVGLLDFNIVKAHFGHTTGDVGVTAVPEPASLFCLFGVAIPMLLKRRAKA